MRRALWLAAALWCVTAVADPVVIESPVERVAVLELFTSHGCSSCPPADAWLRGLVDYPGLWRELVPLAFHVDYWDSLGWPDRFARSEFSQRQRDYERSGGLPTVYTPGFVLNGEEWRRWFRSAPNLPEPAAVGRLRLEVVPRGQAMLHFAPVGTPPPLEARFVVLGFGLSSRIGGGENAGRTLAEDFVVLGMSEGKASGPLAWVFPWPDLKEGPAYRLAVAAWVSAPGNPQPLQAVGGWLP